MSGDGDRRNAVVSTSSGISDGPNSRTQSAPAELILVGTGQVGQALLQRLGPTATKTLRVVAISNRRGHLCNLQGLNANALETVWRNGPLPGLNGAHDPLFAPTPAVMRIVVDATASDTIAACHADWLAAGLHVVSANKLGLGADLTRWQGIGEHSRRHRRQYGDSATVGAGLPLLVSLRRLRDSGERIESLAGVLSGTLAWLFAHYDGNRPFSDLVVQAQRLGYTEPDPWQDLGGLDVARKLLILARCSGWPLALEQIDHRPLLKPGQARDWQLLDTAIAAEHAKARAQNRRLSYVARLDADGRARVGLESLSPDDPLAHAGADNLLAIRSERYRDQALVIRGPGAGPEITAGAMLDDLLQIAQRS